MYGYPKLFHFPVDMARSSLGMLQGAQFPLHKSEALSYTASIVGISFEEYGCLPELNAFLGT